MAGGYPKQVARPAYLNNLQLGALSVISSAVSALLYKYMIDYQPLTPIPSDQNETNSTETESQPKQPIAEESSELGNLNLRRKLNLMLNKFIN